MSDKAEKDGRIINVSTYTCAGCGAPLDGSSQCKYCQSRVNTSQFPQNPPAEPVEMMTVDLLSPEQYELLTRYLNSEMRETGEIYRIFELLMNPLSNEQLTKILRPIIAPQNAAWNIGFVTSTDSPREIRSFKLVQHIISHGLGRRVAQILSTTTQVPKEKT